MHDLKNVSLLFCVLSLLVGIGACGSDSSVDNFSSGNGVLTNKSRVNGTVGTGTGLSAVPDPSVASPQGLQKGFQEDTLLAAATIRIIGLDGVLKGIGISDGRGNFSIPVDPGSDYFIRVESGNIVLKSTLPSLATGSTTGKIVNSRTTAIVEIMEATLGVQLGLEGADASAVTGQIESEKNSALDNPKLNETALVLQNNILSNGDPKATDGSVVGAGSAVSEIAALNAIRDTTPPNVLFSAPLGADNIAVDTVLQVTFSEKMAPGTVNPSSFILKAGSQTVSGAVSYDPAGSIATFTPQSQLRTNTPYTAIITTAVTDEAGNALPVLFTFSFTTGITGDTIFPFVTSTSPLDQDSGISINPNIIVTFSEDMDRTSTTLNETTLSLSAEGQNITGTVSYDVLLRQATFRPGAPLGNGTLHTVTLTTGIRDLAGNPLAANFVFNFTTIPDTIPPSVLSNSPDNGQTGTPVNTNIQANFSEDMDELTLKTAFTLNSNGTDFPGVVTYNAQTFVATFDPTGDLVKNAPYTATVSTGAKDKAGNALLLPSTFSFITGTAGDTTPPTVTSTSPLDLATGVDVNTNIIVTFSEEISPGTLTQTTVTLSDGVQGVSGTVSPGASPRQLVFNPNAGLLFNSTYTATLSVGIEDLAGNPLSVNFVFSFTTKVDNVSPAVDINSPATGNFVRGNVSVTATATDNAGVTQVEFFDGSTLIGTADTTAPYSTTWNTTLIAQGLHTLTAIAQDAAGNSTTSTGITVTVDNDSPTVTYLPGNGATGVSRRSVQVVFSEDMDLSTINNATFSITGVSGNVTRTLRTATFTPTTLLASNTTFTATVTTAVRDKAGNFMASQFTFSFKTEVSFSSNIQGIFAGNCNTSGCHSGSVSPNLASFAFTNIVVNPVSDSILCGGFKYIVPFSPGSSLLLSKVKNVTPLCGGRMPSSVSPLPGSQIQLIETWISEGAKNN